MLPDKHCLSHGMCLYQVMLTLHFLMTHITLNQSKNRNLSHNSYLKSETMGKLINRIPGLRLLISSLPGSALRMHVESLDKPPHVKKPRYVNKVSQSLAW